MNIGYQKSLDGLRGFAILLVIAYHQSVVQFGWVGVTLFFVLSGYLITKVLFEEKEKPSSLKIKFRNFWIRRVLRIFPLYYLYLIILLLIWLFGSVSFRIGYEMPYLFTYSYNLYLIFVNPRSSFQVSHFWSLSVEEQFYILYPVLVLLCTRKQLKVAVVCLVIFAVLFRFFFGQYLQHHPYPGDNDFLSYIYYHPFTYLDSFLLGGVILIFRLNKLKFPRLYLIFLLSVLITVGCGLIVYLDMNKNEAFYVRNYLSNLGIVIHYTGNYYYVWSYINLNLLFSSLILLLESSSVNTFQKLVKKIFEFRPLVFVGKISYGMYIFHVFIGWLLASMLSFVKVDLNKYILFIFCLTATLLLSFLSYHIYEKRFLALKERFR